MESSGEIKNIRDAVDAMSRLQPEASFLIGPEMGEVVSFEKLRDQSILLSNMLHHAGLAKGDKVAFLLDNGLLTAQLFLGTMYGGFVAVPLNVRAGALQLAYMLDHCDAGIVFVEDQYTALLGEALGNTRRDMRVIGVNIDGPLPDFETVTGDSELQSIAADDVALLMYSSGSTGKPKGAVHTHSSILAHGRNSIEAHQLSSADRSLLVLPLYHINAECVTLIPTLLSGGSVVVAHRFVVSKFWDWVDELQITWSALVPTIISELVDWNDPGGDHRQAAFARIRFFRSSSAPLSPSLQRQFLDKFKLPLLQAMGSTEGGNVFSNPVPPGKNKIGSPGLPWGFEARIVDREGADVPRGESGEVLLRGAALMRGYYKDPEGTAAVVDGDGWLHTGDLARQDEDGYFFVVGRSKELIIKGGVNIAPRQIDEVLESHPSVFEAAAVGIPDRYFGEDAVAFVVLRPGFSTDESGLLGFCETRLGHFKTPSRIHFLKELPKGPSGKVQRLRLLDPAVLAAVAVTTQPLAEAVTINSGGRKGDNSVPSSNSTIEQIISTAWREVLALPEMDPEANFFALGGHSLLAIQCLSKLRDKLPIVLSLADFFEFSTVAQQAELVRQRLHAAKGAGGSESTDRSTNWEQTLLQQFVPPAAEDVIPRLDPSLPHPLSPAQQRLWFMELLNPGVPVYNEAEAARLTGDLNMDALERAMNVLVDRREVFRSTIKVIDEVPHAVVHKSWPLHFKKIDLSSLPANERQAEVDRLLIDEPRVPYTLETEPGVRVTLVHLSDREHVFILMMHHIICDWASEGIIWRELSALYSSFLSGNPVVLPALPIRHGDYAAWRERKLATESYSEDLAYWEQTLQGAPAHLELPSDRPRPATMSYQGGRVRWKLNRELSEVLRKTGRQEKTSLFTIFAAALNVLLYRYSGVDDISLGVPLADRDTPELQAVLGFLLHTHVLRTRLSGEMTFRDLLGRVQKGALDLYTHRAAPFNQVVQRLQLERSLSYAPLFQVMLNWRDRDQMLSFIGLEGMTIESLMASAGTSKFDLFLFATDTGDEFWLEMEYSTDLFDQDRIERMLSHYQSLLEAFSADPGTGIAQAPLLTENEYQRLVVDWNRTVQSYPPTKWLDELIEEQVERTPDAVAVVFDGDELTYRQLGEQSDRVASQLQELGVGRNTLVAICMERSAEMLVGLLGILKAGGAYLPLDPMFPRERLAFMLEDALPLVMLTERKLMADLPAHQAQVLCLDELSLEHSNGPAPRRILNDRDDSDLAYVLYTSGSTGRPKGVQIPHRALVNFLVSMQREPGITAKDSLLAITTLSFDIAGLELYLPLTVGARVVIASSEVASDGVQLWALMKEQKPTIMQATPATWRMLLDAGWSGSSRLKILCGGEAWGSGLASELLPRCQSLWNMYGPTETTIWSAVARVEKDQPVLIGQPIGNTTLYILDDSGQPVPVGVPGELYIGGDGLALGYLGRPELTGERFVVDRFSSEAGSRLYKTGDVVQRLANGSIEFLRRADHQVKLRGFRIELGEIEALLKQQTGVRECVVAVEGDEPANKRLAAYIVLSDQNVTLNVENLKGALKERLPIYMFPSTFTVIEKMPLTPNGKIDRRALPTVTIKKTDGGPETEKISVPITSTERRVMDLWEQILGVPNLSVRDNFFESGGHSLLAMRLVTAIQKAFDVHLSLKTLFFAPTVQAQAKAIDEIAFRGVQDHVVPLQTGDASRPGFFLIHSYHLYPVLPKRLGDDQPVYGIQEHSTHVQMDDWALESMMARYVEAIRSVQPHGPYFIGGFCSAAIPAFEVARQLREAGEMVPLLAIIDAKGRATEMDRPKSRIERLRSRWRNTRKNWRSDAARPKIQQAREIAAAFWKFATVLFQNRTIKVQNWWWGGICRFYMKRHLQMPEFLRGKLVAGIRIVTFEAIRNYALKPYNGDIAVFLAGGADFQDRDDFIRPWAHTTSGKTEVVWLPGDHTTAFMLPNINIFAQLLRDALDDALEHLSAGAGNEARAEESEADIAVMVSNQRTGGKR